MKKYLSFLIVFLVFFSSSGYTQSVSQWRGINRDGKYDEQYLLKSWPVAGPDLLWACEDIGVGFGSPTITTDEILVTGKIDSVSYTLSLDLKGNIRWKTPNGNEFTGTGYPANFPGPRSTPTVVNDLVYVNSGIGRIACLEKETGKEKWAVDMLHDFNGIMNQHGYAESLLVEENLVYCFPGGPKINVAALDRFTGKTVWTSKVMGDTVSYCSPMVIKFPTRKVLVTFSGHYLVGLDANTGDVLWSQEQAYHEYHQHCNTPIYADGCLYYIAGEGNGAVKLELSPDGSLFKEIWRNSNIKNVFGGFVKINDYLFTPDHDQRIKCLDAKTGTVVDSIRVNKGSLIYADNMLYCYSDNGDVNLIKLTGSKMEITGKFKVTKGTKEHLAHPVINKGSLYIRHGKALMAYNINQGNP